MDTTTTIRAWKWFTVSLAILNVALCVGILFRNQKNNMQRPERPDEFIISKLHFSDKQVHEFEELRDRHHDSVIVLQDEGRKLRTALFDNLKNANKTEAQVDSLMGAIGNNQKQIEYVTYRHFRQLREICNEEQKKIFDNIIEEIMKKMSGRPPRPDGPPPPGQDGPPPPDPNGPGDGH